MLAIFGLLAAILGFFIWIFTSPTTGIVLMVFGLCMFALGYDLIRLKDLITSWHQQAETIPPTGTEPKKHATSSIPQS